MNGPEDMEDRIGAPVMAVVPHFSGIRNRKSDKLLVVRDKPKSPPAEAYRTVRTNIEFLARTTELKVIAVMSPGLGEGKTTTAANLAVTLAAADRRVVLLGCDLRKPRIHRLFGVGNDAGLSDVLTRRRARAGRRAARDRHADTALGHERSDPVEPGRAARLGPHGGDHQRATDGGRLRDPRHRTRARRGRFARPRPQVRRRADGGRCQFDHPNGYPGRTRADREGRRRDRRAASTTTSTRRAPRPTTARIATTRATDTGRRTTARPTRTAPGCPRRSTPTSSGASQPQVRVAPAA